MAEPADATDPVTAPDSSNESGSTKTEPVTSCVEDSDADELQIHSSRRASLAKALRRHTTRGKLTVGLGVLIAVGFSAASGWQAIHLHRLQQASALRTALVETARQAALNLTTINSAEVTTDIQRILDGSTGNFHDEFQQRSKAFADVVTQAQSKSEGTVSAAGVESQTDNSAQVLVAVNVQTTVKGSSQPDPRAWRMRITVVGGDANPKVSDVQFVQ